MGALHKSLSDDHAVKRIAMMRRQIGDAKSVCRRHSKDLRLRGLKPRRNEVARRNGQWELPEIVFDDHLPDACRGKEAIGATVGESIESLP